MKSWELALNRGVLDAQRGITDNPYIGISEEFAQWWEAGRGVWGMLEKRAA